MTPAKFNECNCCFSAPKGLAESQVMTIPAYDHTIQGGSMDGSRQVVVAWKPTEEELKRINDGAPIFISMIGGLCPHYPSSTIFEATHPA